MSQLELTIDGRVVRGTPGATILETARAAGIDIPTLCQWRDLSPTGACRICVVEVAGAKGLPAACSTPIAQGMVILTESDRVVAARRTLISLLLQNHPEDCLLCEKAGGCTLQSLAYRYQVRRPEGAASHRPEEREANPFFVRNRAKCILCGRCVQACHELAGVGAIDFSGRGFETRISAALDAPLAEGTCRFCGLCVEACPVGALTPNPQGTARTWEVEKKPAVCTYCGVGCTLDLHLKDGKVVFASAPAGEPPNRGRLCAKGRFGWDFLHHPDRLTTPLVREGGRRDGALVPATWEEALDRVAAGLRGVREAWGAEALGVLASAKVTNEENYLLQKLAREVLGTNNLDHCARLCHASSVTGLGMAFGSGAMTNSLADLAGADLFLVIGSNTTEAHPVIGMEVAAAVRRGAGLVVIDPRVTDLARQAQLHLRVRPGTNVALLNALAYVIVEEGLLNRTFIAARTEGFAGFAASLASYTPEAVAPVTGVEPELIRKAARLYARAEHAAILYAMGVTQFASGTANVLAVANLALLTGHVGRPGTGVNPLRGQNNVQGACDMGALPNLLPGYRPSPGAPGLTVTEMLAAAEQGTLKGLYVVGENPAVSDPDTAHVEAALGHLGFLVVQDLFLTETARFADVVLPAAAGPEKEGTFTSTERRVRHFAPALPPPGEAKADWEIILAIAQRLGAGWDFSTPAEIMAAIAAEVPQYRGLSHARLAGGPGLHWPCPAPDHPGTPILHEASFSRGRGRFHEVEQTPPAEAPDEEYPFLLTTGRSLYHYHTGTMTRRSRALATHRPQAWCEVSPEDAQRLGLNDGDSVRLISRRGEITTSCSVVDRVAPGLVFTTFHFAEAGANRLTGRATDPLSHIPEFKVVAVRLEKASAPSGAAV